MTKLSLLLFVTQSVWAAPATAPSIVERLKPVQLNGVLKEREIIKSARLGDPQGVEQTQTYRVGSTMLVRASFDMTRDSYGLQGLLADGALHLQNRV